MFDESCLDTIVACATPPGEGAVAIVRLSGRASQRIANRLCAKQKAPPSHKMVRAALVSPQGGILDDALVVYMLAPASYTGEDVVEFHLHGSRLIVDAVISACKDLGAREAGPGEFTFRAFLNAKIDLVQAEAVADMIAAKSAAQHVVASQHLRGSLSREISDILGSLEGVLVRWRAAVDFPEYDTGAQLETADWQAIERVRTRLDTLMRAYRPDLRKGRRVVLCGAPNVGKSTLLNALAGRTCVIVDDEPGTTRDPVEVDLSDTQARWSVVDTAGIRQAAGRVESRGIELGLEQARAADVCLWLLDPHAPTWPVADLRCVVLGGKSDSAGQELRQSIEQQCAARGLRFLGWVSGSKHDGLGDLRAKLLGSVDSASGNEGDVLVVRQRHFDALKQCALALDALFEAARQKMTLDVLGIELEQAMRALSTLLGRDFDADVLERIFSEFCIGK